jgi:hypothetical protein
MASVKRITKNGKSVMNLRAFRLVIMGGGGGMLVPVV